MQSHRMQKNISDGLRFLYRFIEKYGIINDVRINEDGDEKW